MPSVKALLIGLIVVVIVHGIMSSLATGQIIARLDKMIAVELVGVSNPNHPSGYRW